MNLGYLTIFDSLNLMADSWMKPKGYAIMQNAVHTQFYILPNGTKVNYGGEADPTLIPGTVSQHIMGYGSSVFSTYLEPLIAKIHLRGTLTHTAIDAGSTTTDAILLDVQIQPSTNHGVGYFEYIAVFECEDDFTA